MRVSTSQMHNTALNAILDQQAKSARTQEQLATGKRLVNAADDPAGAARVIDLRGAIGVAEQHLRNAQSAQAGLEREEGVLASVTNVLQRAHELGLQGNNATVNDSDRRAIASEVRERLDELLSLANTRGANGEYVFSGFQTGSEPFRPDGSGNFTYFGDQGRRFVEIGPGREIAINDSGSAVFREIRDGNGTFKVAGAPTNLGSGVIGPGSVVDRSQWVPDTYTITFTSATAYEVRDGGAALVASGSYTPGAAIAFAGVQTNITGAPAAGDSFTVSPSTQRDMFSALNDLIDALERPAADATERARVTQGINNALSHIDASLEHVTDVRATVGARLNAVDSERESNEDLKLTTQAALSAIEDLDYAEAISRFELELTALQAAQQSFLQLRQLSLFNFL